MEINMLSDTQTLPTDKMLNAMRKAQLGDDVNRNDPTVNKLEEMSAELLGKEAALFVPSGTMGNLIAIMVHTQPGQEIILEADSHIYYYEVGGFSRIAGLSPLLAESEKGILDPEKIKSYLRKPDIHYPDTALLCIENSHNRGGGTVTSLAITEKLCELAHENDLKVHIDGARIFNAALANGIEAKELVNEADSVMFCLSKGLSAPVGSMLVGNKIFINKARKIRKLLGGGMRQAGVLAAAGIIAIEEMIERLKEDHQNARFLAEGISNIKNIHLDMETVQTNIVQIDIKDLNISAEQFADKLLSFGLKVSTRPPTQIRLVTHRHISKNDIKKAINIIQKTVQYFKTDYENTI